MLSVIARDGDGRTSASDQMWSMMYTSWRQVGRDSVFVYLGSGFGGLSYELRLHGDSAVGTVDTDTDAIGSPTYQAHVRGHAVTCPQAPPPLGRIRFSVAEVLGRDSLLPRIRLKFATEERFACGHRLDIDGLRIEEDTFEIVPVGIIQPRKRCAGSGPATNEWDHALPSGHYFINVIRHADTNHFVLTVTDSSLKLTSQRATFVTADERVLARPTRNLFVMHCNAGDLLTALCTEVEQWISRRPGVTRLTPGKDFNPKLVERYSHRRAAVFHYKSSRALPAIRDCFASIAEQIRNVEGAYLGIETWQSEEIEALSQYRSGVTPGAVPTAVTSRGGCASSG